MRWNDDLPEEWDDAPDDPPAVERRATAVEMEYGVSILDDSEANAWVYADDAAVEPEP